MATLESVNEAFAILEGTDTEFVERQRKILARAEDPEIRKNWEYLTEQEQDELLFNV